MKTIYLSDNELVNKFVSGDATSLEMLINRYRKQVFTYILLLVKNNHLAEDIFQDTFIKVIKSLDNGKYQDNGKFLAWVLRIAHNLVIDHYRKAKEHLRNGNWSGYGRELEQLEKILLIISEEKEN